MDVGTGPVGAAQAVAATAAAVSVEQLHALQTQLAALRAATGRDRGGKDDRYCFNCNRLGHLRRD